MSVRNAIALSVGFVSVLGLMGCTPEARQDVKEAGANVNQAAEKSAQGTAEAVDKAGDKVAAETTEAVQDTKEAVGAAGTAVKEGAQQAGEAVGGAAKAAGQAVEKTAENAAEATKGATASLALTPKIKNALVASKQIDASTINVETEGDKKMVMLEGTIPTQAKKDLATQLAKKALTDAGSDFTGYTVKNNLKVAK
jgi:osmotically-inducible protein OsmY